MAIVQLIYRSEKTAFFDADTFDFESTKFRGCNESLGITGMLISRNSTFIGFLEGGQDVVFALMEKIVSDRRHQKLDVLFEEVVEHQRFSNWRYGALVGSATSGDDSALGHHMAAELHAMHKFENASSRGFSAVLADQANNA